MGDDVFRDDLTVLELEARVAALAGWSWFDHAHVDIDLDDHVSDNIDVDVDVDVDVLSHIPKIEIFLLAVCELFVWIPSKYEQWKLLSQRVSQEKRQHSLSQVERWVSKW